MELHNLKPAEGSIKKGKRIGRGEGSKKVVLLQEDIMVKNLVQVTLKRVVLRVGNNLYKEEFLSLDLQTRTELNI